MRGAIDEHLLQLAADDYTPVDPDGHPARRPRAPWPARRSTSASRVASAPARPPASTTTIVVRGSGLRIGGGAWSHRPPGCGWSCSPTSRACRSTPATASAARADAGCGRERGRPGAAAVPGQPEPPGLPARDAAARRGLPVDDPVALRSAGSQLTCWSRRLDRGTTRRQEPSVEQRELGRTGRQVSVVGLGTWQLGADWGDVSEAAARDVLEASAEEGVTFFDTADVYGDGRSEQHVGRFLAAHPATGFVGGHQDGPARRAGPGELRARQLPGVDRPLAPQPRRRAARPGPAALPAVGGDRRRRDVRRPGRAGRRGRRSRRTA